MNSLLTALATRRIFIVYCLSAKAGGGLDKIPIDPLTGYPSNAQDQSTWLLPAEALAYADLLGPGYGVGLMIQWPFFCIDIDYALDANGQWSPLAHNLCRRFAGAAVEVSVSGKALHIFGTYSGNLETHRTRNSALHLELYTSARFIALTGTQLVGNILTDHTAALLQTLSEFFPPKVNGASKEWTEVAASDWRGPDDDDALLSIALNGSGSAGVIFGSRASFKDLFMANDAVLSKAFPPQSAHQVWDYSGADQALANHLAFYTGSNCERMARLMQRSALRRDKWERADYFQGTIIKAAGECKRWFAQRSPMHSPAITAAPPGQERSPEGTVPPGGTWVKPDIGSLMSVDDQVSAFSGFTYVEDVHRIMNPIGNLLGEAQFNATHSGYTFLTTADGRRPAKKAWDAFVFSELHHFPKVRGTFFTPKSPPGAIVYREGSAYINSWVPIAIERTPGDPAPFLNHLQRILPAGMDAEILLNYFRFIVQHPGVKAQWAPLLQGVEGNGKSLLSTVLERCIGSRYTHWPKAAELGSRFNNAFYGKLLICVEDVYINEDKGSLFETLKPMITADRLEIEGKGIDKVTREVCFNFIMNSNHKDAIRKTRNDRRIAPFFCAQQKESDLQRDGLTGDYFKWFRGWCEGTGGPIMAHYLATSPIPDELNPAVNAIRAPITSSTNEAIEASRGSVEQEIVEAMAEGRLGFRGGWVSSVAVDRLLEQTGKARVIPRLKRRELLLELGLRPHPGLQDGRVPEPLTDGTKPVLWTTAGHTALSLTTPQAIIGAYVSAQAPR